MPNKNRMRLSVVVPVFNEEKRLPELLNALGRQKRLPDEVTVVDDASTDNTAAVVRRFKPVSNYPIKYYRLKKNSGIGAARYVGALHSLGDVVVQTDADCIPPEDWLLRIESHFSQDPNLVGLAGPYKEYSSDLFRKTGTLASSLVTQALGGNTSFRRRIFHLTPRGRGEELATDHEDVIFWGELNRVGKCLYDPKLFTYHKGDKKWKWLGVGLVAGLSGLLLKKPALTAFGVGVTGIQILTWNVPRGGTKTLTGGLLPHIQHDIVGLIGLATAKLPTTRAFYGGLVAQHLGVEGVKLITKNSDL